MLRHILAISLLISHVNFSMFIAQVDEVDIYDADGRQINDINSLAEYVNDVILHHGDKSRKDEDDDNARYFHLVKIADYSFNQQIGQMESTTGEVNNTFFPSFNSGKPLPVFYDVVTPPPKQSA